jgi:hypothetical protein
MTDGEYLEMLLPETRRALELDLQGKIDYVMVEKFVPYRAADEILRTMENMLKEPRKTRMPCLVAYGDSHNGKTSLIEEFMRRHPPTDGFDSDPLPVIDVEAPAGPDTPMLYDHILDRILIPYKKSHTLSQKEHLIKHHGSKLGTKMLIVDEIHNILAGSPTKRAFFMNSVKGLSNQMKLNIVVFGVSTALLATSTDEQIQSRFKPMKLPKWRLDEEYASLLASLELTLPFGKHPGLSTDTKLATKILDLSEGVLGYIVEIVNKCAIKALEKKKERITSDELKEIEFTKPSDRRALASV